MRYILKNASRYILAVKKLSIVITSKIMLHDIMMI